MSNPLTFDASFAKAMRLLHSSDQDATDQLKSMLDECQALKKVPQNVLSKQPPPQTVKPVVSLANKSHQVSAPAPIIVASVDMDCSSTGCVVCKRSHQSPGNELVECQECHGLYHIECHKQGLAGENVKDPRFVWYCFACTSRRKKAKIPSKTSGPLSSSSGNGLAASTKEQPQQSTEESPFKSWSFIKK